jgi:hypothetical protein
MTTTTLKRLRFDFIDGLDGAILPEDDRRFVKECLDQAIANYVAMLKSATAEMRRRAERGCTGKHTGVCCDRDADIPPAQWCNRCLMSVAAVALSEG